MAGGSYCVPWEGTSCRPGSVNVACWDAQVWVMHMQLQLWLSPGPARRVAWTPKASTTDGRGPTDTAQLLAVLLGTAGLGWGRGLSALREQINTHSTSFDSCSDMGITALLSEWSVPRTHCMVGVGCSPMGKGQAGRSRAGTGRACQSSASEHGVRGCPSTSELAVHQGPEKVGSTGKQGRTEARRTSTVGHWLCFPAVHTLPGAGAVAGKQRLPEVFHIFI